MYRLHTPPDEGARTLLVVMRRGSLFAAEEITGHKYETIGHWLRAAAQHAEVIKPSKTPFPAKNNSNLHRPLRTSGFPTPSKPPKTHKKSTLSPKTPQTSFDVLRAKIVGNQTKSTCKNRQIFKRKNTSN